MEVAGADLDGDGATDLAVLDASFEGASTLLVDDEVVARIPGRPVRVVAADLDADGDVDLGWATTARFGWAESTGAGWTVRGVAPIAVDDLAAVGGRDGPALATSAGGVLSTWTRTAVPAEEERRCGCASAPGAAPGLVAMLLLVVRPGRRHAGRKSASSRSRSCCSVLATKWRSPVS
jgi:hypothetical protein